METKSRNANDSSKLIFKTLRRVGYRGSKNTISEAINAYSNIEQHEAFFTQVLSQLGFVLQKIPYKNISANNKSENLFLIDKNGSILELKYSSKSEVNVKSRSTGKFETLDKVHSQYTAYIILPANEDIRKSKERLSKLNPLKTLGNFRLLWISTAALLSNVLALASAIFIMVVYDRVLPNEATESLYALAAGVGLAILFDSLLKSAKSGIINRATEGSDIVVSEEIYDQFVEIAGSKNKKTIGELSTIVRDLEVYREFMSTATLISLIDIPFIFIFIYVISLISGPLYVVPLVAVPAVFVSILLLQPVITRISKRASKTSQTRQSILVEILSGLDPLRASGAFAIMKRKFMQSTTDNMVSLNSAKNYAGFNAGFLQAIQQIAQVAIIVYGFHLFVDKQITMGAIIGTVILSGKALAPLAKLGQMLSRMGSARVARTNIINFLSLPRSFKTSNYQVFQDSDRSAFNVSNVTLRLNENAAPIFSNFNLQIKTGERVAIIGPTGAGKTTLSNLLSGLNAPETGAVHLNGADIRTVSRADFFKNVGVVFQEPWIFGGTLRENIALGFDEIDDVMITDAIKLTGLYSDEMISQEVLDGRIESQGKNLSGGQKQSIALSRALVFEQKTLLLDEPTSAMDQNMEQRLISSLQDYLEDRTLILITHKAAMLRLCNRIVVLENGVVAFDGSKEEYVARVNAK